MALLKTLITIRGDQRVLVVEDNQHRIEWFSNRLGPGPVDFATTPDMALQYLEHQVYDVIFLDHDAGITADKGPIDFQVVAQRLRALDFSGRVIIHSMNYVAAQKMQHLMRNGEILTFGNFELRRT